MKKILLIFGSILFGSGMTLGQCPNSGVSFGSGTAPSPGANINITTCAYAGEYQTIASVVSGNTYTVANTGGASNYVTIYNASFTAIFWGANSVSFTAPASGTFYSQVNLNDGLCGTESACHTVNWANTTPPPPCPSVTTPWTDNVETIPPTTALGTVNCWTNSATSGYDWNVTSGGTPSSGTGALAANSGTNFFYTEASGAAVGAEAILVTPEINLAGVTNPMLAFYYHMFGGQIGTLNVEITINNGTTWNPVTSIVGAQQATQASPFLLSETVLTGYTGLVKIRFRAVSNGSFEGDISLDDISVIQAPTCPQPVAFIVDSANLTTASFSWTPTGTETQWYVEYGAIGFTPGTGTVAPLVTLNPNTTITGLTPNLQYSAYVRAFCSAGDTSFYTGPLAFNTFNQGLFMDVDNACGPGFINISATGTLNLLGDDGEVGTAIPFPVLYQGTPFTNITIGSNGAIIFGSQTAQVGFTNGAMSTAVNGLYPFWDDLGPENSPTDGVYFQTLGTAPNRQFIVQWNKPHLSGNGQAYIFQSIIEEATHEIYYIYNVVSVNDAFYDFGANATVGIAGPNQDIELSFNNSAYLTNNSCAHFFYTDCPNPTNLIVDYIFATEVSLSWNAGLYGEINWTVIYDTAGFDPLTGGTSVALTGSTAVIAGLMQNTQYDFYLYADCQVGSSQSNGLLTSVTTLPYCSNPSSISSATAVDSVFTDWSWVADPSGLYPISNFNVQYGTSGFTLGSGTTATSGTNFSDTTASATLLSGGVYEIYVQALCGVYSSEFIGPVQFIMPLQNDSICDATLLAVDGSLHVFSNAGATVQANEANIAPPATGAQQTDGWINSNLNRTTWFKFNAPASGQVRISGIDEGFDGQMAVYSAISCSPIDSLVLVAANDNEIDGTSLAPNFTVCGLTPGVQYFLMHDSFTTGTGIYSIRLSEIVLNAGTTASQIDVCVGDSVDLFSGIANFNLSTGTWIDVDFTQHVNGSMFGSGGLVSGVYNFDYQLVDGCATDMSSATVKIFANPQAGTDGMINICKNQPTSLLNGLSGTFTIGGAWMNPQNAPTDVAIDLGELPNAGQFNYTYIVGNNVCPDDSSVVTVNVNANCDFLGLDDLSLEGIKLFPNPTNDVLNIETDGLSEDLTLELLDMSGKVVWTGAMLQTNSSIKVDLSTYERGVYILKLKDSKATVNYRVVKN